MTGGRKKIGVEEKVKFETYKRRGTCKYVHPNVGPPKNWKNPMNTNSLGLSKRETSTRKELPELRMGHLNHPRRGGRWLSNAQATEGKVSRGE